MASGNGAKQVAGLHQRVDRLVDVADEYHAGRGADRIPPAGEGTGGHKVLHDLHAVLVLEGDPGDFIEGHHVPQAHQPHHAPCHVVKQVGHGRSAPRRSGCCWG